MLLHRMLLCDRALKVPHIFLNSVHKDGNNLRRSSFHLCSEARDKSGWYVRPNPAMFYQLLLQTFHQFSVRHHRFYFHFHSKPYALTSWVGLYRAGFAVQTVDKILFVPHCVQSRSVFDSKEGLVSGMNFTHGQVIADSMVSCDIGP